MSGKKPQRHPGVQTGALTFEITCPKCGKSVEWLRGSKPLSTETSAIVRCTGRIGHEMLILVRVLPMAYTPDTSEHCGTSVGYQRHRRAGESACDNCKRANTQDQIDRRLRSQVLTTNQGAS